VSKYTTYDNLSSVDSIWSQAPSHWAFKQLKRCVLDCTNGIWGAEPESDENDTIVIRVADFNRDKLRLSNSDYTYRKIEPKEKSNRSLKRNDLLLEKSGGGEKTLVGQVVLFDKDFDAVTSNFVAKMTPSSTNDPKYLNYVFACLYAARLNICSIKQNTGIQNLDSEAYLSEKFSIPPKEEQTQIAAFLDRETAKIDLLIEKQQQLIKLLEEKRQAVISHAVTKGLNSDAPMKDSGVEWLGEVPEHWTTTRIKFTAQTNPSKSRVRTFDNETLVSFIPMESIGENGELNLTQTRKLSEVINGYTYVGENDVIIAKITPCFENGKGSIARGLTNNIAFATTEVVPLRPNDLISSDFLYHLLSANPFRKIAEGSMYGAGGQKRVSDNFVSNYTFALPPQAEQSAIVSFIKITIDKLDLLKYKATQAIELMKERRTALISAAVTGKIDVRNTI